jgi:phage gp29-like protein
MAELKVIITDETSKEQVNLNKPNSSNTQSTTIKTPETNQNKSSSKGLAVAAMVGQSALNYTTSNIGKWTGNSRHQTTVNNVKQVAGIAAMAYINPYLAIASCAIQAGTTAIDTYQEQKWDKRQSSQSLARAGYNSKGELVGRRH